MRLLQQILDHLVGGWQIVGIDVEPVGAALGEHLRAEDPRELPLAEHRLSRLVRDGEVVALEPDGIGICRHQVGASEQPVLRILMPVAPTTVLGVHQGQLVDDLVSLHLVLRSIEHELVPAVTEDADGHVDVVPRKNARAELVQVREDLHGVVHVGATNAPSAVQPTLDRHGATHRHLERTVRAIVEPHQRTTDNTELSRIHQGVQLACVANRLLARTRRVTRGDTAHTK